MYTANNIANNILSRGNDNITPMKLQKLLYIVYKEYLHCTGEKLFNEPFEAWRYGPVVRCVYDEFRLFGASPITGYAKDAEGKAYMATESTNPALKTILDNVYSVYKEVSGIELSKLTHENEKSAWRKTVNNHNGIIKDEDIEDEKSYLRQ